MDQESKNTRRYWSDLKIQLKDKEECELYEILVQLKLPSSDGKTYLTDCANTKSLFRIIQSIPSKKAEPFKKWLAKVSFFHDFCQSLRDNFAGSFF